MTLAKARTRIARIKDQRTSHLLRAGSVLLSRANETVGSGQELEGVGTVMSKLTCPYMWVIDQDIWVIGRV